jgi:hypothetical protein
VSVDGRHRDSSGGALSSEDPLRTPLLLVTFGLAGHVLWSIGAGVGTALAFYAPDTSSLYSAFFFVSTPIYLAGSIALITGLTMLARKKRPGHELATVSAVLNGVDVLYVVSIWSLSLLITSTAISFRLITLLGAVLDIAAIVTLVVSLRALATSRARSFDAMVAIVITVASLEVLRSIVDGVVNVPGFVSVALVFAGGAARVLLLWATRGLILGPGLPEPALEDGSAYRGPTGPQ